IVRASVGSAALTAALTLAFVAIVVLVIRPAVVRLVPGKPHRLDQETIAFTLVALLLSALTTEAIGVHAIFGAFLLGALVPPESSLARGLATKLQDLVTILLLPAFFAFTGMRTRVELMAGTAEWTMLALIVLVATAGKFGGTLIAGRLAGMSWRPAASLGILMNTRGLM